MTEYFFDQHYNDIRYGQETLNLKEFESCTFTNCVFSDCNLMGVTFIDCQFNDCIFDHAKINHTAFRTVFFNDCQIKEVNFAMSDKLIFEMHFDHCSLDFSKFYALKLKGISFNNSSLIAVDFMATDLTGAQFYKCDLYRSEFDKANASKVDFRTSCNYTIDPTKTKLKKAQFALEGVKGLLYKHGIVVE
ncbi:pentapeptide repeat-containing protein [Flavobacterium sp. ARAG 55.4]|uniref:pentapeptide repeat-containing protein n=1 Tax=Flavobacterium sp. ARAG 55.4 TaxID=3451357 RepID=UPI003F4528C7